MSKYMKYIFAKGCICRIYISFSWGKDKRKIKVCESALKDNKFVKN